MDGRIACVRVDITYVLATNRTYTYPPLYSKDRIWSTAVRRLPGTKPQPHLTVPACLPAFGIVGSDWNLYLKAYIHT